MMLRKWISVVCLAVLALIAGACTSGLGGSSARNPHAFDGRVEFGDTGLTLLANSIVLGDQVIKPSETGAFQGKLKPGTHKYAIDTYLGRYTGEIDYDGSGTVKLIVPEFEGWSEKLFDEMLIWSFGGSARWSRGDELAVWIQETADGFNVEDEWAEMAWESLKEWESQLNRAFTVHQTHSPDQADIKYEWTTSAEINGAAGVCSIRYSISGPNRGSLIITQAKIAVEYADSIKLYLHESGHCIGLNHSSVNGHVMKQGSLYILDSLHPTEVKMAGLLYSVPKGTGPFSPSVADLGADQDYIPEYDPLTGTVTITIPIYVHDLYGEDRF